MKDLTIDPIGTHIVRMAVPIAAGMFFQTLYILVDLYFVSRLGATALAGVSAAANLMFIVFALTQILGVGTVALVSHAAGRKDRADATTLFNQSLSLALAMAVATLLAGYLCAAPYMNAIGADAATAADGVTYLYWFLPNLALQCALVVMSSALRATGIVQPAMLVQVLTVALKVVLAPVLIAGWGTGVALGVAGAGLASSLAMVVGVALLVVYFHRLEKFVAFDIRDWWPNLSVWRRLLRVGLPAGGEFALMFVFMAVMYGIIRRFGPDAQAGFGIGMRVMQSLFLPAMAVAFAAAPIVGQNYAAGKAGRVRRTFVIAMTASAAIMAVLTVACKLRASWFIGGFTADPTALAVGTQFLQVVSWNFVASGWVFTCSAVFQGLGNTVPAVLSSASRIVSFVVPALVLASHADFRIVELWYVSVASMALQALVSLWLVRRELRRRLAGGGDPQPQPGGDLESAARRSA